MMFATFHFIPVNFIEFLIKFLNRFTINIPFINIYIYIYIYILLHILFSSIIGDKKHKWENDMITNITFKNCRFKIGISKTTCDDMVYCCCCFFGYCFFSLFIIGIILFWYNKFRKSSTFLQLSWSNTLRSKSSAIWKFLFDFFVLWKMQFRNFSNGSVNPFGDLCKTLIDMFGFFSMKVLLKQILHRCC